MARWRGLVAAGVIACGCSCNSNSPPATAGPAAVELPRVEKWEYKQVARSKHEGRSNIPVSYLLMESELNDAGNEGWELVAVTPVVVPAQGGDREYAMVATFKRPKKK